MIHKVGHKVRTLNKLNKTKLNETNNKKEIDKEKESKSSFGEFENVYLTESEALKLKERFGDRKLNEYITKLDNYVESTGKKYKSHYATIISWINKEQQDKTAKEKSIRFNDIGELYD